MVGLMVKILSVGMSRRSPSLRSACSSTPFRVHWISGSGLPPSDRHRNRYGSPSRASGLDGTIRGGPAGAVHRKKVDI